MANFSISQLTEDVTAADSDLIEVAKDNGNGTFTSRKQKRSTVVDGLATEAALTSHESDTSNPHAVTAVQVGAPTTAALTAHTSSTANPHSITKAQVGLSNAENTSDLAKPVSTATQTALDTKADTDHTHSASQITDFDTEVSNNAAVTANTAKNSYPSADATKLAGVATGATANISDATLLARANHTGTQAASTILDFQSAVASNSIVATVADRAYKTAITVGPVGSKANYVCDGVEDEVEILAAIYAANTAGGGDVVLLPGATFNLSNRIYPTVKISNVRMLGYGATLLGPTASALNSVINFHPSLGHTNIVLEGLTVDGNGASNGGVRFAPNGGRIQAVTIRNIGAGNGLDLSAEGSYLTKNVRVLDSDITGYSNGIRVTYAQDIELVSNRLTSSWTGGNGVQVDNINTKRIQIRSNHIFGTYIEAQSRFSLNYGIYCGNASVSDLTIANNHVENIYYNGIAMYGDCYNYTVVGNVVHDCGHSAIASSPSHFGSIVGNTCYNVTPAGESGVEIQYKSGHLATATSHDITVSGNQVHNCYFGITVNNNENNDAYVPYNIIVSGNQVTTCTQYGLNIDDGKRLTVVSNNAYGNATDYYLGSRAKTQADSNVIHFNGDDIEVTNASKGLVLKSPDGTRYRLTVANGGTLSVIAG